MYHTLELFKVQGVYELEIICAAIGVHDQTDRYAYTIYQKQGFVVHIQKVNGPLTHGMAAIALSIQLRQDGYDPHSFIVENMELDGTAQVWFMNKEDAALFKLRVPKRQYRK